MSFSLQVFPRKLAILSGYRWFHLNRLLFLLLPGAFLSDDRDWLADKSYLDTTNTRNANFWIVDNLKLYLKLYYCLPWMAYPCCECFWHAFASSMIWKRTFHNTCTCRVVLQCGSANVGSGWPTGGKFCHKIDIRGGGRYFRWLMGYYPQQGFLENYSAFHDLNLRGILQTGVLIASKCDGRNPQGFQGPKGWLGTH